LHDKSKREGFGMQNLTEVDFSWVRHSRAMLELTVMIVT